MFTILITALLATLGAVIGWLTYPIAHRLESFNGHEWRLPLTLLSALLYASLGLNFMWSTNIITAMSLISTLLLITLVDLKTHNISDELNWALLGLGLVQAALYFSIGHLFNGLIAACLASGLLLLMAILTKGGIGGGDIKMVFGLGFYFAVSGILKILLITGLLAGFIGLGLLLSKKKGMKEFIPLGPMIACAALIQLLVVPLLK